MCNILRSASSALSIITAPAAPAPRQPAQLEPPAPTPGCRSPNRVQPAPIAQPLDRLPLARKVFTARTALRLPLRARPTHGGPILNRPLRRWRAPIRAVWTLDVNLVNIPYSVNYISKASVATAQPAAAPANTRSAAAGLEQRTIRRARPAPREPTAPPRACASAPPAPPAPPRARDLRAAPATRATPRLRGRPAPRANPTATRAPAPRAAPATPASTWSARAAARRARRALPPVYYLDARAQPPARARHARCARPTLCSAAVLLAARP